MRTGLRKQKNGDYKIFNFFATLNSNFRLSANRAKKTKAETLETFYTILRTSMFSISLHHRHSGNFAAKFQRECIISHVKLPNCHGNFSCISISAKMASRFKTVTLEEVTDIKEAAENLNA